MASDKKRPMLDYTDEYLQVLEQREVKKPKLLEDDVVRLGIIGPSSKRSVNFNASICNLMTPSLYEAMVDHVVSWIEKTLLYHHVEEGPLDETQAPKVLDWSKIHLVSGGASWSDHVAVSVFLRKQQSGVKLTLFLPCEVKNNIFVDNGKKWGAQSNPGGIANKQHREFSAAIGRNSLGEIVEAVKLGAVADISHFGFFARDAAMAKLFDHLLAFGWSATGNSPDTPGTRRTWEATPQHVDKRYVSLQTLSDQLNCSKK